MYIDTEHDFQDLFLLPTFRICLDIILRTFRNSKDALELYQLDLGMSILRHKDIWILKLGVDFLSFCWFCRWKYFSFPSYSLDISFYRTLIYISNIKVNYIECTLKDLKQLKNKICMKIIHPYLGLQLNQLNPTDLWPLYSF